MLKPWISQGIFVKAETWSMETPRSLRSVQLSARGGVSVLGRLRLLRFFGDVHVVATGLPV